MSVPAHNVPAHNIDTLSSYCKATADALRLQTLRVLSRESFGVLELCHILSAAQPALSHHLKILAKTGLVESRREGTSIFYRRALIHQNDPLRGMRQTLLESIDNVSLEPDMEKRIEEVHEKRHALSKDFFARNAHRFQTEQDLIAKYEHYRSCMLDVLENEPLPADATVVEIGPGESNLILDLAASFAQVIAVDNNQEMLDKTRLTARKQSNVDYLLGELPEQQINCDLMVLNMVLHHLASPATFFQSARQKINTNGRLLVADLCLHDQAWTQDACGDLWLGFDSDDMDRWAANAGFNNGQSLYLGLKNGFQVMVKTYF